MLPSPPKTDAKGFFEPVIGTAPPDWPWALPHLYAVNVAPDGGMEVISASASPDGSSLLRKMFLQDRNRIEMVGYWRRSFRVVHSERVLSHAKTEQVAAGYFSELPVRFLLRAGSVTRDNSQIEVTGDWPNHWQFARYQDVGVFCAFIYQQAKSRGAGQPAEEFRSLIRPAWPPTEQLLVYTHAIGTASSALAPWLSPEELREAANALAVVRKWISGQSVSA